MSNNIFTSNDNKKFIWDMMMSNDIFKDLEDNKYNTVKERFDNIIAALGSNINSNISNEELISLNKKAIIKIKTYIDNLKKYNIDTTNNEKMIEFDNNLELMKNNFLETITLKKPDKVNFIDEKDEPIETNNMIKKLEELQKQREELNLMPIENNNNDENVQKNTINLNNDDKEKIIINTNVIERKKITSLEELLGNKNKRVSFNLNDNIVNKTIADEIIADEIIADEIKADEIKADEIKDVERIVDEIKDDKNISNIEMQGEKKVNDTIKLNTILDIIKQIDQKQDRILNLLINDNIK